MGRKKKSIEEWAYSDPSFTINERYLPNSEVSRVLFCTCCRIAINTRVNPASRVKEHIKSDRHTKNSHEKMLEAAKDRTLVMLPTTNLPTQQDMYPSTIMEDLASAILYDGFCLSILDSSLGQLLKKCQPSLKNQNAVNSINKVHFNAVVMKHIEQIKKILHAKKISLIIDDKTKYGKREMLSIYASFYNPSTRGRNTLLLDLSTLHIQNAISLQTHILWVISKYNLNLSDVIGIVSHSCNYVKEAVIDFNVTNSLNMLHIFDVSYFIQFTIEEALSSEPFKGFIKFINNIVIAFKSTDEVDNYEYFLNEKKLDRPDYVSISDWIALYKNLSIILQHWPLLTNLVQRACGTNGKVNGTVVGSNGTAGDENTRANFKSHQVDALVDVFKNKRKVENNFIILTFILEVLSPIRYFRNQFEEEMNHLSEYLDFVQSLCNIFTSITNVVSDKTIFMIRDGEKVDKALTVNMISAFSNKISATWGEIMEKYINSNVCAYGNIYRNSSIINPTKKSKMPKNYEQYTSLISLITGNYDLPNEDLFKYLNDESALSPDLKLYDFWEVYSFKYPLLANIFKIFLSIPITVLDKPMKKRLEKFYKSDLFSLDIAANYPAYCILFMNGDIVSYF